VTNENEFFDLLKRDLIRDEGAVPYMYFDSENLATIGVGRLIDKKRGGGLSDDEIEYLLNNDIKRVMQEAQLTFSWFNELNDARKSAILNMCFQLGTNGVAKFQNMIRAILIKDWEAAYHHALDSRWAQQTPKRAERVAWKLKNG